MRGFPASARARSIPIEREYIIKVFPYRVVSLIVEVVVGDRELPKEGELVKLLQNQAHDKQVHPIVLDIIYMN